MRLDPDGLRRALEEVLALEASEAVARHRGDPDALSPAEVLARHDWIDSDEITEVRAEFAGQGLFLAEEASAYEWHLVRLRREQVLARARRSLETLGARRFRGMTLAEALETLAVRDDEDARAAVDDAVTLAAPVLDERRFEADEHAGAYPPHADSTDADLAAEAERLLAATEDAFQEARERVRIEARPVRPERWVRALRSPEGDAIFSREGRLRRLAGFFPSVARELASRVRAVSSRITLGPRPRVLVPRAPDDVRFVVPSLELGLASELFFVEALGRAVAAALVSPALPPALRYPTVGSVGRALGLVAARAVVEPAYARRDERLRGLVFEPLRARGEAMRLLSQRLAAVATLAERRRLGAEACRDLAASHLGIALSRGEAILTMRSPSFAEARLRAHLAAERLYPAFVERYDEDFLWNPRFEEPLRAAAERGGLLSAEAFTKEMGA